MKRFILLLGISALLCGCATKKIVLDDARETFTESGIAEQYTYGLDLRTIRIVHVVNDRVVLISANTDRY